MTAIRFGAVFVALAFAGAGVSQDKKNKLPDDVLTVLEKAGELEVYSLDGNDREPEKGKDAWHGAKVLGKTTVKGEAAAKAVAAVKKGVEEGERGARCFIPRHGIRATYNDKTVDLVICFECHWVHVYPGEAGKPTVLTTSDAAHKALDKILTDANIKLAKPAK